MRALPTFLTNLTRVLIVAELSTRREIGTGYNDPRLLEIADRAMCDPHGCGRLKSLADDSSQMAPAVWHLWIKPHVIKMLVEKWGASEEDAKKTVESYFVDDSPTYHPERRDRWRR